MKTASHGEREEAAGSGSAEKPQLGVLVSTGEQQLPAGYHGARVSQAQTRPRKGHNGEEGGGGGRRGRRIKKSY